MIEALHLTKRYGDTTAVDDLSFQIKSGQVTGFLGPNGAGKTTTMRMIIGLDAPSTGTVTINGRAYRDLAAPITEVGALLDAKALHGGRSARNHLRVLAASNGLPAGRVDTVLRTVGLQDVADRRAGGFSLGMGQRLGIAAALLGDPGILMFDEPVNGLDPEGILWVRNFMRQLASEGRTVLVSSHLMSEMALTADHVIVVGRGKLLRDQSMASFIADASTDVVRVRSPDSGELARLLAGDGVTVRHGATNTLEVEGLSSDRIGTIAASARITLYELATQGASLEEAYMSLTEDSIDYRSSEPRARQSSEEAEAA
jgi:ABC-2 type transport system ATP-binding protein